MVRNMGLLKRLLFVFPQESGLYSDVPGSPSCGVPDSPRPAGGSGGETSNAKTTGLWVGTERAPGHATRPPMAPSTSSPTRVSEAPVTLSVEDGRELLAQLDSSHNRHGTRCDTP